MQELHTVIKTIFDVNLYFTIWMNYYQLSNQLVYFYFLKIIIMFQYLINILKK